MMRKDSGASRKRRQLGFVHILLIVLFLLSVTTYGIIDTQSEIIERQSKKRLETYTALATAKQGLLDFVRGDGLRPHLVERGVVPPVDVLSSNVPYRSVFPDFNDDLLTPSRPGQLPCPDTANTDVPRLNSQIGPFDFSTAAQATTYNNRLRGLPLGLNTYADASYDGIADPGLSYCFHGTVATTTEELDTVPSERFQGKYFGRLPWREYFDGGSAIRGVFAGDARDGNGDRLWYAAAPILTNRDRPLNRYLLERSSSGLTGSGWLSLDIAESATRGTDQFVSFPGRLSQNGFIAAMLLSPGQPTAAQQADRLSEDSIYEGSLPRFRLGTQGSNPAGMTYGTFFENQTIASREFEAQYDDLSTEADIVVPIHRDEILAVMAEEERRKADRHLDAIADSLAAFYKRNRSLPNPAAFSSSNGQFLDRRLGDPQALQDDYAASSDVRRPAALTTPMDLQGGSIRPMADPPILREPGGLTIYNHTTEGLPSGRLPATNLPLIRPQVPPAIASAVAGASYPPFGVDSLPGEDLETLALDGNLIAVIPANTPVRAAHPFFTAKPISNDDARDQTCFDAARNETLTTAQQNSCLTYDNTLAEGLFYTDYNGFRMERQSIGNFTALQTNDYLISPDRGIVGLTIPGVSTPFLTDRITEYSALNGFIAPHVAAVVGFTLAPANVSRAARLDTLFNSKRYGYDVLMPENTWLVSDTPITIIGLPGYHDIVGGNLTGLSGFADFAFAPIIDPNANVYYGVSRDLSQTGTIAYAAFSAGSTSLEAGAVHSREMFIPTNTPVAPGSQGLLPSNLGPHAYLFETTDNSTDSPYQERLEGRSTLLNSAQRGLFVPTKVENYDFEAITRGVAAIVNPDGAYGYFPAEVTMHPLEDVDLGTSDGSVSNFWNTEATPIPRDLIYNAQNVNTSFAEVSPAAVAGSTPQIPTKIDVRGYVTFPEGSRIYYPPGRRVPLGHNAFNHGSDNIFNYRRESLGGGDFDFETAFGGDASSPFNAVAYLAPGAVISGAVYDSSSSPITRPNGSELTISADITTTVTLVNGGYIAFNNLLHYTDGDLTMLPKTPAQRAYRIEGEGLGIFDYEFTPYSESDIAVNADNLEELVDSTATALVTLFRNSGYHLYPYYNVFEQRSAKTKPDYVPSLAPGGGASGNFAASVYVLDSELQSSTDEYFSRVDIPLSRSDVKIYGAGPNSLESLTVAMTFSNTDRFENPGTQNLMDAVGIDTLSSEGEQRSPFIDIADTTSLAGVMALTENYSLAHGIDLFAAPGRYTVLPVHQGTTTNRVVPYLFMSGFSANADYSPLYFQSYPADYLEKSTYDILATLTATYTDGASPPSLTNEVIDATTNQLGIQFPRPSDTIEFGGTTEDLGGTRVVVVGGVNTNIRDHIGDYDFREEVMETDVMDLGGSFDQALHVVMKLNSDALMSIGDPAAPYHYERLPAGSYLEHGWLEGFSHQQGRTLRYFSPGTRVASGVGYYPAARAHMIRLKRDTTSLPLSQTITIASMTRPSASANPIPNDATPTVLTEARMVLPAGADIGRFELWDGQNTAATPTVVNADCNNTAMPHCVRVPSEAFIVGLDGTTPTVVNHSATEDIYILQLRTDPGDLRFDFAANGGGALVTNIPIDGVTQERTADLVTDGQMFRIRLAEHISGDQPSATNPNANNVEAVPWMDLAWSGKVRKFGYGDMDHQSLVFNQNHPLFYAVADDCLEGTASSFEECGQDPKTGLNVQVPAGEHVRLPEDHLAPAGLVIHPFKPNEATYGSGAANSSFRLEVVSGSLPAVYPQAVRIDYAGRLHLYEQATPVGNTSTDPVMRYLAPYSAPDGNLVTVRQLGGGLIFQNEPDFNTSDEITLHVPDLHAATPSYGNLVIRQGGLVAGSGANPAHSVSVASGSDLTLGMHTQIEFDSVAGLKRFELGDGSEANSIDLSGYQLVNPQTSNINNVALLDITALANDVVRINRSIPRPLTWEAGTALNLELGNTAAERPDFESFPAGTEVVIPGIGYSMQGVLSGSQKQLTAVPRSPTGGLVRTRNLPAGATPITQGGVARLLSPSGLPTYYTQDLADLGTAGSAAMGDVQSLLGTSNTDFNISAILDENGEELRDDYCWFCTIGEVTLTIPGTPPFTNTITLSVPVENRVFQIETTEGYTAEYMISSDLSFEMSPCGNNVTAPCSPNDGHNSNELVVSIGANLTPAGAFGYDFSTEQRLPIPDATNFLPTYPNGMDFIAADTTGPEVAVTDWSATFPSNWPESEFHGSFTVVGDSFDLGSSADFDFDVVVAMAMFENTSVTLTIAGEEERGLVIGGGQPIALFDSPETQMDIFTAPLTTSAQNIGEISQLYFAGDFDIEANNLSEAVFQLPQPVTVGGVELPPGSLVFPKSGRVLKSRYITNAGATSFAVTLGANGATGYLVAGGGAGAPAQYRKPGSFTETRAASNTVTQMDTSARIESASGQRTSTQLVLSFSNTFYSLHVDFETSSTSVDLLDLDTRWHGGVLTRPSQTRDTDNGVVFRTNIMADDYYEHVPEQHQLLFEANAVFQIEGRSDSLPSSSFDFPSQTTMVYLNPSTSAGGIDATALLEIDIGALEAPAIVPGANALESASGSGVTVEFDSGYLNDSYRTLDATSTLDVAIGGATTTLGAPHDYKQMLSPMRQNLWIKLNDEMDVDTDADGVADLTIPDDSLINPFYGVYLPNIDEKPSAIAVSSETIEFGGLEDSVLQTDLVFSTPALMLPAGSVINSGSKGMDFEKVKGLIAFSPAPLRGLEGADSSLSDLFPDNRVQCGGSGFGPWYSLEIDQLRAGISSAAVPDISAPVDAAPPATGPASHGFDYTHPCMLLDLRENFDGDREFIYTSGMLQTPRRDTTNNSVPPLARVNDRMRMIGGRMVIP